MAATCTASRVALALGLPQNLLFAQEVLLPCGCGAHSQKKRCEGGTEAGQLSIKWMATPTEAVKGQTLAKEAAFTLRLLLA